MKISIIIPVLNEQAEIADSIERAWLSGGDEVIVVDGGSTDNTTQVANEKNCCLIHSTPGRAVQQNRGAEVASGDVLLFLHADTRLAHDGCGQIRRSLQSGPSCEKQIYWGGFRQKIDSPNFVYRIIEKGNTLRAQYRGLVYGDQGLFIDRNAFRSAGGFPVVPFMEDYVLSSRLSAKRLPRIILPGPLTVSPRRWEKNGAIRQTLRNWSIVSAFRRGEPVAELARRYSRHDQ